MALTTAAFLQPAHAATLQPYLDPVRSEITNQLTIASNTVPVDKKLITSLKSALSKLNKPGTASLVGDTKLLSTLAPAFNKTSLSNSFYLLFNGAADNYLALLLANAGSSSTALGATYPSSSRTAAQKKLEALFASLVNAGNALDLKTITRLLSSASTALVITDKLIDKAEGVAAPASSTRATMTVTVSGSRPSTSSFKSLLVGAQSTTPGTFLIIANGGASGAISLVFSGLHSGVNDVSLTGGLGGVANGAVAVRYFPSPAAAADASSGSAQVTWNPATRTIYGTFSFTGVTETNDPIPKPITFAVTGGTFFATY